MVGIRVGVRVGVRVRPARVAQQRDVGEQAQQQPPLRRRDVLGKQRVHDAHLGGLGLGLELGLGLGFRGGARARARALVRCTSPRCTRRATTT